MLCKMTDQKQRGCDPSTSVLFSKAYFKLVTVSENSLMNHVQQVAFPEKVLHVMH